MGAELRAQVELRATAFSKQHAGECESVGVLRKSLEIFNRWSSDSLVNTKNGSEFTFVFISLLLSI